MKKTFFMIAVISMALTSMLSAQVLMSNEPSKLDYDAWKQQQVYTPERAAQPTQPSQPFTIVKNDTKDNCELLVPLDDTFTLAMNPNDDGSTSRIQLPFTFDLYGSEYTSCWRNNSGKVTLNASLCR